MGFPGGSDGKESDCNARELSLIPGLGRSPGEGNGCPLQYLCLENPMDKGNWCPWGHKQSDMTEQLSTHKVIFAHISITTAYIMQIGLIESPVVHK